MHFRTVPLALGDQPEHYLRLRWAAGRLENNGFKQYNLDWHAAL